MNEKFENIELFEKKLEILNQFNQNNFQNLIYNVVCNYHGINLNLFTKSLEFINSLKNYIPTNWLECVANSKKIYILGPNDFLLSNENWCDESSQDCLSLNNNTIAIQRDFAAKIYKDFIVLICEEYVGDGFLNFLRWYISEKLLENNKFVLHSSCVLDKNNFAHLFLGHSGAGKTTITSLSTPRLVLGDDMNIVTISNSRVFVEAAAIGGLFNSMIGHDKKVELKAIYWLKQSVENKIESLDKNFGLAKVLASFANLNWDTLSNENLDKLLNFSNEVTDHVSIFNCLFNKSDEIWKIIDA